MKVVMVWSNLQIVVQLLLVCVAKLYSLFILKKYGWKFQFLIIWVTQLSLYHRKAFQQSQMVCRVYILYLRLQVSFQRADLVCHVSPHFRPCTSNLFGWVTQPLETLWASHLSVTCCSRVLPWWRWSTKSSDPDHSLIWIWCVVCCSTTGPVNLNLTRVGWASFGFLGLQNLIQIRTHLTLVVLLMGIWSLPVFIFYHFNFLVCHKCNLLESKIWFGH